MHLKIGLYKVFSEQKRSKTSNSMTLISKRNKVKKSSRASLIVLDNFSGSASGKTSTRGFSLMLEASF